MKSRFLKTMVEPGSYSAELSYDGRWLAGEVDLLANRPPRFELFGELMPKLEPVQSFPQDQVIGRLIGRLRNGYEILFEDVDLTTWFPNRHFANSRFALVGMGIAALHPRSTSIKLQITGLDNFFGIPPLLEIRTPANEAGYLDGEFVGVGNPKSAHAYQVKGLAVECQYDSSAIINNYHELAIAFAPAVTFNSEAPVELTTWLEEWVSPLLGLVSFATRAPQQATWVTAYLLPSPRDPQAHPIKAQLFGSGITQSPYQAKQPEEWTDPDRQPLFVLNEVESLPGIMRRWRALEESENLFLELYRQTLFQRELPERAKFLYLVQALESLDAFEGRAREDQEDKAHQTKIDLFFLENADCLTQEDTKFLKATLHKQARRSLASRLRSLAAKLPKIVPELVQQPKMTTLWDQLEGQDIWEKFGVLRNALSHGSISYAHDQLEPWTRGLEVLCQGSLLRLLGFQEQQINVALSRTRGSPPAMGI